MNGGPRESPDAAMERGMGRLLQVGVLLACAAVTTGGALLLWQHADDVVEYRRFVGEAGALRQPTVLLHAVARGEPAALIQAGVLLLIATPVARVVYALLAFLRQRDWLYLAVSVTVLVVLLAGILRVE